jgi:hypothetical protein
VPCFLCWINLTHMSHISSISWWNLILNHFRMIPGVPKFVAVQTWLTKLFLPCSPHFPSGLVEFVLSSPGAAHGKMCHAHTGGFETPSRPRHLADLWRCEGLKVSKSHLLKLSFWTQPRGPDPSLCNGQVRAQRGPWENTWGARISPSNGESFWHLWREKTYFLFFFGTFWVSIVGEVHSMLPLRCECQACDRAQDTHTTRLRHGARLGMMRGSSRDHVNVCICTYGHLQTHWFWWFFGC